MVLCRQGETRRLYEQASHANGNMTYDEPTPLGCEPHKGWWALHGTCTHHRTEWGGRMCRMQSPLPPRRCPPICGCPACRRSGTPDEQQQPQRQQPHRHRHHHHVAAAAAAAAAPAETARPALPGTWQVPGQGSITRHTCMAAHPPTCAAASRRRAMSSRRRAAASGLCGNPESSGEEAEGSRRRSPAAAPTGTAAGAAAAPDCRSAAPRLHLVSATLQPPPPCGPRSRSRRTSCAAAAAAASSASPSASTLSARRSTRSSPRLHSARGHTRRGEEAQQARKGAVEGAA